MDNPDLKLFKKFFEKKEFRNLLIKVEEERKKFENSNFNIFSLVSDQYRKENLHSDILAEFLNPQGRHGQGNVFLMKFIELINDKAEKQIGNHWRESSDIKLNLDNFKDAKVVREQGRIDILITGLNEAIIFESKINNTGDTKRQLPNYFNLINNREKDGKKEFGSIVIVYMPYIPNKLPKEIDWEENDRKNIYPKFVLFNAFEAKNEDTLEGLVKNWLQLATMKNYTILYQYSELLKSIGGQTMKDSKEITAYITDSDNWSKIVPIADFWRTIPNQLIKEAYEEIFNEVTLPTSRSCTHDPPANGSSFSFYNYEIGKENKFRIIFQCLMNNDLKFEFKIRFWDEKYNQKKPALKDVEPIINSISKSCGNFYKNSAQDEMHLTFDAPLGYKEFINASKCLLRELKRISDIQEQIS